MKKLENVYGVSLEEFKEILKINPEKSKTAIDKIENMLDSQVPHSFIDFEEGFFISPCSHFSLLEDLEKYFFAIPQKKLNDIELLKHRDILLFHTEDNRYNKELNGYWHLFPRKHKKQMFFRRYAQIIKDYGFEDNLDSQHHDYLSESLSENKENISIIPKVKYEFGIFYNKKEKEYFHTYSNEETDKYLSLKNFKYITNVSCEGIAKKTIWSFKTIDNINKNKKDKCNIEMTLYTMLKNYNFSFFDKINNDFFTLENIKFSNKKLKQTP